MKLEHPQVFDINKQICDTVEARARQVLTKEKFISCILLSTKLIAIPFVGTRQESWSHSHFKRDNREYSSNLRSVKCDELVL